MKHIKQTIETLLYAYDHAEFMPVTIDGELANRTAFLKYKLYCLLIKRTLV